MSEQFKLTSAEEWNKDPRSTTEWISAIQTEAIKHGMALAAEVALDHKLKIGSDQTAMGFRDAILTAAKEFKL